MIRPMQLDRIECRNCREKRWSDGLRCPHCNEYQNPHLVTTDRGSVIDSRYLGIYSGTAIKGDHIVRPPKDGDEW